MLDFRVHTFLEVCRQKSYTKAARALNITQPAVTQHIHYLEREYGTEFFDRNARTLTLTGRGRVFYWYALTMESNSQKIYELLAQPEQPSLQLRFGATLSIGEYVMPEILADYLEEQPDHKVSMLVENTESLLKKLDKGEIDFAVIEGKFRKDAYSYALFSNERYIAVCARDYPLPREAISIDRLMEYPFIIREKGSGTRDIFEKILDEYNLKLEQIQRVSEIGDFQAIKYLVTRGLGITFLYETVVSHEIEEGALREIKIENYGATREFNFVYLKNSILEEVYMEFYQYCQSRRRCQTDAGSFPVRAFHKEKE
jgi:DNA-binding transcriptional LysR family regulator